MLIKTQFVFPFFFEAKNMMESLVRYMKNGIKNPNIGLPINVMYNCYWGFIGGNKRALAGC